MLRIHPITSASDAKRYYLAADYYSQGQETVGEWGGRLAAELGLSGLVDKESFDRLCDNLHPEDGTQLTPRNSDHRRIAYDFTFSVPKSVSVVGALAPRRLAGAMETAFDEAVNETMAEIEADIQTRVRTGGADYDRVTGNMVYASFDHTTARPEPGQVPDMHRHRHVVAFSLTKDPVEGRIKAGQFGAIKRDGEYYTAAFYARLAGKLEALGLPVARSGGREWEIAGVPESVIERFSKRTAAVEEEHAERMANDPHYRPEYKHELGAKTRGKKQKELTPEELKADWAAQLTPAEQAALERVYRRETTPSARLSAGEAAAFAIAHCFERDSIVAERELKRAALLHGLGHVSPKAVAKELPRQGVITRELDGRRQSTTLSALREERFYTGFAADGLGSVRPVGLPEGFSQGALNQGQWQAVKGLLESSDRVNAVEGAAGTGKTTMLAAYDRAMRMQGQKVTYLATSTNAVEQLRKEGFQAETVAHFLLSERAQTAAKGGRVVVDEASMLSHKDAYRFFRAAESLDLKPVLLGDRMQHGSVAAGAVLSVLKAYGGIQPLRLTEIRRQHGQEYREAVRLLSEGKTLEGFDALDRLGYIRELPEEGRYRAIAAEYLETLSLGKTCLVVSPTHAEGERIAGEIRRQMRAEDLLGEERSFTRLVPKNLTEAQRGDARNYQPGDVLQFHQNAKGIRNGERLTHDGDAEMLPLKEAAKFQVYRPEEITLAVGETVRFTANVRTLDKRHKIANGSRHRITGFTRAGDIRLENGWVVEATAGHLTQGSVVTSFVAQGSTVDRAIVAQSAVSLPASNREQAYVSYSRAREGMTLYVDSKEELREAIARSSAKRGALDLVRQPRPALAERIKELRARRRHMLSLQRLREAPPAPIPTPERQVPRYG